MNDELKNGADIDALTQLRVDDVRGPSDTRWVLLKKSHNFLFCEHFAMRRFRLKRAIWFRGVFAVLKEIFRGGGFQIVPFFVLF